MSQRAGSARRTSVMVFGVGAFTQGVMQALREDGARVSAYLTRAYAHYGPSLEGKTFESATHPTPFEALAAVKADFVVPMSIEWALKPWTQEFLERKIPILCPTGDALLLERDRDFARRLCGQHGVAFPASEVARSIEEARAIVQRTRRPYVIKNPLCSPFSPVHTIVCESPRETRAWLERVDYSEGIFLQEYLGRAEAGHIAVVSGGEIHSLVTNQEYKRAFDGNLGVVAGAPLGGLVERDPEDKYGLARELLHPLLPWFRKVNFNGPVQVTAIRHDRRWHVLEYNVRLGITSGPMILRLLANPLEVLRNVANNRPPALRWRSGVRYGCSLTLAGYGYPFLNVQGPRVPVELDGTPDCPVWWTEVAPGARGTIEATGHRIADVAATAGTLDGAIRKAYKNIRRIRSLGSYYRLDVGGSLWPPGTV